MMWDLEPRAGKCINECSSDSVFCCCPGSKSAIWNAGFLCCSGDPGSLSPDHVAIMSGECTAHLNFIDMSSCPQEQHTEQDRQHP